MTEMIFNVVFVVWLAYITIGLIGNAMPIEEDDQDGCD